MRRLLIPALPMLALLVLSLLVLALLGGSPARAQRDDPCVIWFPSELVIDNDERWVVDQINQGRSGNPLRLDPALTRAAQYQAEIMPMMGAYVTLDWAGRETPSRARACGVMSGATTEVLFRTDAPHAYGAYQELLADRRALDPSYTHVGIAATVHPDRPEQRLWSVLLLGPAR